MFCLVPCEHHKQLRNLKKLKQLHCIIRLICHPPMLFGVRIGFRLRNTGHLFLVLRACHVPFFYQSLQRLKIHMQKLLCMWILMKLCISLWRAYWNLKLTCFHFQEVTPNNYKLFQDSNWWRTYRCSVPPEKATRRYFCRLVLPCFETLVSAPDHLYLIVR